MMEQYTLILLGFIFLSNVVGIGIISGKLDALIMDVCKLILGILEGESDETD